MSTETIIKVGGISKEFAIKKKGPHVAITGGEDYIGGEDFIGGGSSSIEGHRDIKGL